MKRLIREINDFIYWAGHPALGSFTTFIILYISQVLGTMCFVSYMLYQLQEYRELKDTCSLDVKDFMMGVYGWATAEIIRRLIWTLG